MVQYAWRFRTNTPLYTEEFQTFRIKTLKKTKVYHLSAMQTSIFWSSKNVEIFEKYLK